MQGDHESCSFTVARYNVHIMITQVAGIAKQKHLGCKKVRGQSEATLQTGRRDKKAAEAKKLLYQIFVTP